MIMNNLKMGLALIALMVPLLLCAHRQHLNLKHSNHKSPIELLMPVEAFFETSNKELIIEFAQDWKPVTYVVYRDLYMPHSNSTLSISLENIPAGIYELTISDDKMGLTGVFVYE